MSDKFEFIDAEYAAYQLSGEKYIPSIVKMCLWMAVSRSGFYEWRAAPESATARRRTELGLYVRKSFEDSDETYGYRRVHADLRAWGVPAGPELVRSVMRELGLEPCQPRPWRFSLTEGDGQEHDIPDLVNRDFTAGAPGEKMVGDITYVSTWEGWVYLATVIDCHTKAVIGWAVDNNYKTPLIEQAIAMAARNYRLAAGAIFHSDRGSNYTSAQFAKTLKKYSIRHSVGRTGICYDKTLVPYCASWRWWGENLTSGQVFRGVGFAAGRLNRCWAACLLMSRRPAIAVHEWPCCRARVTAAVISESAVVSRSWAWPSQSSTLTGSGLVMVVAGCPLPRVERWESQLAHSGTVPRRTTAVTWQPGRLAGSAA